MIPVTVYVGCENSILRSARKRCRSGTAQSELVNLVRWGTKQR